MNLDITSSPSANEPPPEGPSSLDPHMWRPPAAVTGPLTRDEVQHFSQLRPWRTGASIVAVWVMVIACLQVAVATPSYWATMAAFLAMAVLQNHLVLWTHEASHFGLSRRKPLNDLIADLCISGPTGIVVGQYRWQHLRHHRHLGDPEAEAGDLSAWMCIRRWHFLGAVARHATGRFAWMVLMRYLPTGDVTRPADWPRRSGASIVGL